MSTTGHTVLPTCGPSSHHHKGQQALAVLLTAAGKGCQLKALADAVAQGHCVCHLLPAEQAKQAAVCPM
jgi:hypothetical protein